MKKFEVGKTYEIHFYKGVDENGELVFDKANPKYWHDATAKVIKRTAKMVTIENPWGDGDYRPRVDIDISEEYEMCWTYEFRMYATWEVVE